MFVPMPPRRLSLCRAPRLRAVLTPFAMIAILLGCAAWFSPAAQAQTITLFHIATNPVKGNYTDSTRVTISSTAPPGGVLVNLSSSNTSAATVPARVTIPSGSNTTTFNTVTPNVTSTMTATLTDTLGSSMMTINLTVNLSVIAGVSLSPSAVVGGGTSTGTVTLNAAQSTATTVVAAGARQGKGFWRQVAGMVRETAGRHMFSDGNKRTAYTLVNKLVERHGVSTGVRGEQLWKVILDVAKGKLRDIDEITTALRGF